MFKMNVKINESHITFTNKLIMCLQMLKINNSC